jgi:hypothetical protein
VVDAALAGVGRSRGSYSWFGLASSGFWIDPAEGLLGVLLIQLLPTSLRLLDLFTVLS